MEGRRHRTSSARDDPTDAESSAAEGVSEPDTYRAQFDNFESPSNAVVLTVRDATDADRLMTPPLYDSVNPEALDNLFCRPHVAPSSSIHVSFRYLDCNVTVRSSGEVEVRPD